jgi:excisionase family DNA binding protein
MEIKHMPEDQTTECKVDIYKKRYAHQPYLNYQQASLYSGLSVGTLRRRAKEGKLTVIKHGGRVLIEQEALDSMLHAGDDQDRTKENELCGICT